MNLPLAPLPDGARGRALALALLAIVMGLVWAGAISPLLDWYAARAETIADRRALLVHMTGLGDSLPALRRAAGHVGAAGPQPTALLDGESDAIAGAGLQGMVQEMASQAGATLASAEALPGEQRGSYRRIGVRINLNADWPVLVALLKAIESNPIRLLVDDLQFHAVARIGPSGPTTGAPQIDTSLMVLGFRAGRQAGAPSGSASIGQQGEGALPVDVALTAGGQEAGRGQGSGHGQEPGADAR
jgi:general secretion pathway protein M